MHSSVASAGESPLCCFEAASPTLRRLPQGIPRGAQPPSPGAPAPPHEALQPRRRRQRGAEGVVGEEPRVGAHPPGGEVRQGAVEELGHAPLADAGEEEVGGAGALDLAGGLEGVERGEEEAEGGAGGGGEGRLDAEGEPGGLGGLQWECRADGERGASAGEAASKAHCRR